MEKAPQSSPNQPKSCEDVVFDMAAYQICPKGPVADGLKPLHKNPESIGLFKIDNDPRFHDLPPEQVFYQLYTVQEKAADDVGEVLGISGSTVASWLRKCNIPSRTVHDAVYSARRIQKVKEFWGNPTRREETVNKIQAPAARLNRTEGVRRYHKERAALYEKNPQLKIAEIKNKMGQIFGCDPKLALYDLHVSQKLSIPKISQKFGLAQTTISSWLDFLGIERMKPEGHNAGKVQISSERSEIVEKARNLGLLGDLTELQREVLEARYGENKKSMGKLASEKNIRRQAIQQAEQKAVKNLVRLINRLENS